MNKFILPILNLIQDVQLWWEFRTTSQQQRQERLYELMRAFMLRPELRQEQKIFVAETLQEIKAHEDEV